MEKEIQPKTFKSSSFTLQNRAFFSITGVEKIIGISTTQVQLEVAGSGLIINGTNLEVKKLDVETGVLEVDGTFNAMKYASKKEKTNFFKRIFK